MASATILAALASGQFTAFWCVEVGYTTPLRATDYGVAVTVGGNVYTPRGLDVKVTRQLVGGTVSVQVDDDGTIEAMDDAQDSRGLTFKVFRVFRLATGDEVESHWDNVVESCSVANEGNRITFSAGTAGGLKVGPATPETDERCVHDFKSLLGCKYAASETWCDGSYTRCGVLANQLNFVAACWAPVPGTVYVWNGNPQTVPGSTTGAGGNTGAQTGIPQGTMVGTVPGVLS